jgi:glycosyltransferase involved in cell wall biosynthesis
MISFIIPTYNAEKTIENTINSILMQEKSDIEYEIIVVNDGSTDNTDKVMQKFNENTKVKYFTKENKGVADTRNYGVNKASGEYIIFVDSDDYISKDLLKDIESYIRQGIELIKWNPIFVDENKNELTRSTNIVFEDVTGEQGFNLLFGKDNLIDCLWNYAIKKEIMLKFPTGTYHEDFAVMPLIMLKAKSMTAIDKYEYYYVQSKNSIMRNENKDNTIKKLQDKLNHYDNLIKEANNMKLEKVTKENLAIFATNALLVVVPELERENKRWFKKGLKTRNIAKNIKVRNFKQLIKRLILEIKY